MDNPENASATAEAVMRRFRMAEGRRDAWTSLWREVYE